MANWNCFHHRSMDVCKNTGKKGQDFYSNELFLCKHASISCTASAWTDPRLLLWLTIAFILIGYKGMNIFPTKIQRKHHKFHKISDLTFYLCSLPLIFWASLIIIFAYIYIYIYYAYMIIYAYIYIYILCMYVYHIHWIPSVRSNFKVRPWPQRSKGDLPFRSAWPGRWLCQSGRRTDTWHFWTPMEHVPFLDVFPTLKCCFSNVCWIWFSRWS